MNKKFCMFILSHGRADRVVTVKSLKNAGYTGDWFIVIDNEDKMADEYYETYGDKVIMFNKKEIGKTFDIGDNFKGRNVVVFARNACFEIAKEKGYTYFMQLDDDYSQFGYKFNKKGDFKSKKLKNLDYIMEKMILFYEKAGITCLAFAQGGDFIGGKSGMGKDIRIKRKAMNTMLCSVERPFQFLGRINEDVTAYVRLGQIGKIFMTLHHIAVDQKQTQSNKSGLTDVYLEMGTYVKSFYSLMYAPSSVKITKMGNKYMRIHHKVRWRNTVPCILDESYKKL